MSFSVIYSRHVCKFFFINNVSNWHFSCLPHYNEAWIQETGPLTQEESQSLDAFAIYHGISKTHGLGEIRGEKYWSADIMVGEVIVGALVPGGVLAPLVGGKIRDLASEAERLCAAGHHDHADRTALTGYYLPLMQEYIDAAKPIDAELIERAIAIFHSRRDEFSRTSPH
jgi:hypothetical protein